MKNINQPINQSLYLISRVRWGSGPKGAAVTLLGERTPDLFDCSLDLLTLVPRAAAATVGTAGNRQMPPRRFARASNSYENLVCLHPPSLSSPSVLPTFAPCGAVSHQLHSLSAIAGPHHV